MCLECEKLKKQQSLLSYRTNKEITTLKSIISSHEKTIEKLTIEIEKKNLQLITIVLNNVR